MVESIDIEIGFQKTEVGLIPSDWEVKLVEEVADVKSGKRLPLGKRLVNKETSHPYIRVTDMFMGGVNTSALQFVPDDVYRFIKNYRIFVEDIFISVAGSLGIIGKIPIELDGANLTENADRLTNIICDRDYLLNILTSSLIQTRIESEKTFGAQPKLALTRIKKFPIPLPPTKEEQTAIATALNDADKLVSELEKFIVKKRNIRQGAIQELMRPKEGWVEKRLGDCLLQNPDYGINAAAVPFNESLPLYLRITDITEDGKYSKKNIVSVNNILSSAYYLENSDLVFARTGASVGKTYLYDPRDGKLVFAGFLIRVKPNPEILMPEYLKYFTQIKSYRDWIQTNSMRTGQPGINGNEYQELILNLPPDVNEQRHIAEILTDMEEEIEILQKKLEKFKMIKQGMMQELLTGKIRLI
ncbi:MAG TPA: restriction endonuclease subunit S [Patescibacteria group bacterium]